MIRYEVRNRNLNLATAIAASIAISVDAITEASVTNRLFFRKFQYGCPMTLPSRTERKFPSVGCSGTGCGVREKISVAGLNAVDTIHTIGNRVTSATSTPSVFSPARRSVRDLSLINQQPPAGRTPGRSRW